MAKYELYKEGRKLDDNEYLLKIRKDSTYYEESPNTGFLTKFNKNGSIPIAFDEWGKGYHSYKSAVECPIYIFKEIPRKGWKLHHWRFGKSQNWAAVLHPKGFILEIYLSQLLDIVKENTIINGEIQGEFYWKENKLIKK